MTTWTEEMKRLRSGPMIQTVLDYFSVTANGSDIRPKFMMYSGHDTSIARYTQDQIMHLLIEANS